MTFDIVYAIEVTLGLIIVLTMLAMVLYFAVNIFIKELEKGKD